MTRQGGTFRTAVFTGMVGFVLVSGTLVTAFGEGSSGMQGSSPGAAGTPGSDQAKLDRIRTEEKKLLEMRQDLLRQIDQNQKLERQISKDRVFSDKLRSKEMQQLIQIYEKMAPRTAAAQINMMTEDLALVLISGMNPRKASRIMRYVDPKIAVRISSDLAARPVRTKDAKGTP